MKKTIENVMEEVCEEPMIEAREDYIEKRDRRRNIICNALVCLICLAIGAVILTAIFCKIDLLATVMLGCIGLEFVVIGLLGLILAILKPDEFNIF